MYIMPMSFEIFTEQQRILQKIQMQMMNDTMMGGDMGGPGPQMRPFWGDWLLKALNHETKIKVVVAVVKLWLIYIQLILINIIFSLYLTM